jgi:hypothetical protein
MPLAGKKVNWQAVMMLRRAASPAPPRNPRGPARSGDARRRSRAPRRGTRASCRARRRCTSSSPPRPQWPRPAGSRPRSARAAGVRRARVLPAQAGMTDLLQGRSCKRLCKEAADGNHALRGWHIFAPSHRGPSPAPFTDPIPMPDRFVWLLVDEQRIQSACLLKRVH